MARYFYALALTFVLVSQAPLTCTGFGVGVNLDVRGGRLAAPSREASFLGRARGSLDETAGGGAGPPDLQYCGAPADGAEGAELDAQGFHLKQVQVVFRHGARSSLAKEIPRQTNPHDFSCTLDPGLGELVRHWPQLYQVATNGNESLEALAFNASASCAPGELAARGYQQHVRLGQHLRAAYPLMTGLSPEGLYARSTDFQRTIASLASILTGILLPDLEGAKKRGPFSLVVNRGEAEETLLGSPSSMGVVALARQAVQAGNVPGPQVSELADLFEWDAMPQAAQKRVAAVAVDYIANSWCDGGALPCKGDKCVNSTFATTLVEDADRQWCEAFAEEPGSMETSRLSMAPLLGEIVDRMRSAQAPRVALLSGHDTTLARLLAALRRSGDVAAPAGAVPCHWPPLASHLVFELWATPKGSDVVRVLYNGRSITTGIRGCDVDPCPLDQLAKGIAPP